MKIHTSYGKSKFHKLIFVNFFFRGHVLHVHFCYDVCKFAYWIA